MGSLLETYNDPNHLCKGDTRQSWILDSTLWIPDYNYWILDYNYWIPDSLSSEFQSLAGFQIP